MIFVYIGFIFLLTVALIWSIKFLKQTRRIIVNVDKVPGPPRLPWPIGNAIDMGADPVGFFWKVRQYCDEYRTKSSDGILRLWLGHVPYVIVFSGRAAEIVFSSYKFLAKGPDYSLFHPWLGTGLLTSTDEKWRSHRKLLTPAFHFRVLQDFMNIFTEQSQIFANCVARHADTETAFDINPFISRCTLDIMGESIMGKKLHAQREEGSAYVKAVYTATATIYHRVISPFFRPDVIFRLFGRYREWRNALKVLHGFTNSLILEHQSEVHSAADQIPGQQKAFLNLLYNAVHENGRRLENVDIREELDTFVFEGHDTTATAASFAIFLLGCHPEIQQKAFDELNGIFGKSDRGTNTEDSKEMVYLDLVIKEALRLYPPVPMISRTCDEDTNFPGSSVLVPKGCIIGISIFCIQRDPEVFPNPDIFNPDRFSDSECQRYDPFDYVPFSAGPRNCIGQKFAVMQLKTLLSTLLRKYRIESLDTPTTLTITAEIITRAPHGINVKLFSRV